jgi:hypothetical protein
MAKIGDIKLGKRGTSAVAFKLAKQSGLHYISDFEPDWHAELKCQFSYSKKPCRFYKTILL